MNKDLTQSSIDRQSILNNPFALEKAQEELELKGIYFTNQQIADFYGVSLRTVTSTIADNEEELTRNGLEVLTGKKLRDVLSHGNQFGNAEVYTTKTTKLTVSTVKTVLNFSMLLKTSEKAREVRMRILDITVQVLENKTSQNTKYINQRDREYIPQAQREAVERKTFTNSIKEYIDMGNYKYAYFTNEIYKAIFRERAQEYKTLLKLTSNENIRNTLYSEVLLTIASFEAGLANDFENHSIRLGRKLSKSEADEIIGNFSSQPMLKPFLDNARTLMASRDNSLRDVRHEKLSEYITAMSQEDYEKFLGEQSKSLEQQIQENKAVFERLKDK
ncbi:DNA-binding protein [Lactococcus lactis]|uniref:DNA-binding protein n=1 Tax=Lactococcus lactis TaxID=1358 RepID=UPI001914D7DE|nr:DNA-binding protein [Lactococcus lactis]MBK5076387.1 DNA-binding protein [Lactococcus lactis]